MRLKSKERINQNSSVAFAQKINGLSNDDYKHPFAFNEETKGLYRKIMAIFDCMLQENS